MTPARLAKELGISDKTLRGFLRRRFPRHAGERGSSWSVTADQATAALENYRGTSRNTTIGPPAKRTPIVAKAAISNQPPPPNYLIEQRQRAAHRFKPDHIRLLLVAEMPPMSRPPDPPRYFYFESVSKHDYLFRGIVRAILTDEPDRANKIAFLDRLRGQGVFLIDLKSDPTDLRPLSSCVPGLVERCRQLKPDQIILIKSNVYDEAFASLRAAKLPVVDARIPFPSSWLQTEFASKMALALKFADWVLR